MKTDNKDSEKDLNANPHSRLNTNVPTGAKNRFPESRQAREEADHKENDKEKDDNIELLANDVKGTVSDRDTSSSPTDIAGVSDIDRRMRGGRRNK